MNMLQMLLAGGAGGGGDPRAMIPGMALAAKGKPQGPLAPSPRFLRDFSGMVPATEGAPIAPPGGLEGEALGPSADTMPGGLPTAAPEAVRPRGGVFDRIGDFVGSDRGKGALLRAGASMLSTGDIGGGVLAGAGYVDQQKAMDARQAELDRQFGLDQRRTDIGQQNADVDALYKGGMLENEGQKRMIDALELEEAMRKNRAGEQLTARQQQILEENNIRTTQASIYGSNVSRANTIDSVAQRERDSQRDYDASIYGTDSSRYVADENRAWREGPTATTKRYDEAGNVVESATAARPVYGELRYDAQGNAYRLDQFTGRPVRVTPSTIGRRGPLAGQ